MQKTNVVKTWKEYFVFGEALDLFWVYKFENEKKEEWEKT